MSRKLHVGTALYVNDGGGGALQKITNLISVEAPKPAYNEVTIDPALEDTVVLRQPGLLNPGNIIFRCYYEQSLHTRLLALLGDETSEWLYDQGPLSPGTPSQAFDGWLKRCDVNGADGPETQQQIECEVVITSEVTAGAIGS